MAIYRCLLDIAAGMDYLHSLGVLHGARHVDIQNKVIIVPRQHTGRIAGGTRRALAAAGSARFFSFKIKGGLMGVWLVRFQETLRAATCC